MANEVPGSGPGLRTTKERLSQHYGDGASLTVKSEGGAGTTIRIELPTREAPVGRTQGSCRGLDHPDKRPFATQQLNAPTFVAVVYHGLSFPLSVGIQVTPRVSVGGAPLVVLGTALPVLGGR